MPNITFSAFVSSFKQAINCKKIEFGCSYSFLIEWSLKVLINDGFIKNFYRKDKKFYIEIMSLDSISKYNKIILYSTPKKIKKLTYCELVNLCWTGGYFLISTPYGIINDSEARKLKSGGVLLLGIF